MHWCRKIDNKGPIFRYSCSANLVLLKVIVFKVCQHEYMNCPMVYLFMPLNVGI